MTDAALVVEGLSAVDVLSGKASEVLPGVWLGGITAFGFDDLREVLTQGFNVRHIVRCIPEAHGRKAHAEAIELCQNEQLTLTIVEVEDDIEANIAAHFPAAFAAIDAALAKNEGVLVHCQAGVSRSASIVTAYVMRARNATFDAAYEHVRARRPAACPNYAFAEQLVAFHDTLHATPSPFDCVLHEKYQHRFRGFSNRVLRDVYVACGRDDTAFHAKMTALDAARRAGTDAPAGVGA